MSDNGINLNWRGGLEDLVKELDRQKKAKVDFIADARSIRVRPADVQDGCGVEIHSLDRQVGEFLSGGARLSDRAIGQLGDRVTPEVPVKFGKALVSQQPQIASSMFNQLLDANPSRILFRCLDGRCRAVLSNKYRVFDDLDIAFNALDTIRQKNGTVLECTATEARFEIKFTALHMVEHIEEERGGQGNPRHLSRSTIDPSQFKHLGAGAVCPFVRVTHSGVGEGGLGVGFGLLRLACINGAVTEQVMNQIHLGSAMGLGLLQEDTIAADSKAVMLKARDFIASSLDPARFRTVLAQARKAVSDAILAPSSAVNNLVENAGLTDSDREGILSYFLRDYDQNRWGLSNAVSRHSQDTNDADRASTLESVAGRLIADSKLLVEA